MEKWLSIYKLYIHQKPHVHVLFNVFCLTHIANCHRNCEQTRAKIEENIDTSSLRSKHRTKLASRLVSGRAFFVSVPLFTIFLVRQRPLPSPGSLQISKNKRFLFNRRENTTRPSPGSAWGHPRELPRDPSGTILRRF